MGLLKIFGIRLPKTVKQSSFNGVVRPLIEMGDVLAHALVPLLYARVVLYQHFLELDRRIKRAPDYHQPKITRPRMLVNAFHAAVQLFQRAK